MDQHLFVWFSFANQLLKVVDLSEIIYISKQWITCYNLLYICYCPYISATSAQVDYLAGFTL